MQFQSPEEQQLLARLKAGGDFRHYVNMLWGDYKRSVRAALYAAPAEAESSRGVARSLHSQLSALGIDPDAVPKEL